MCQIAGKNPVSEGEVSTIEVQRGEEDQLNISIVGGADTPLVSAGFPFPPPCLGLSLVSVLSSLYRLVGLVVRHPPREWKILGSNPACAGIFSGLSHTSDSKIGTPVATLPGAWRDRVSAGTGQPGVSIL